MSLSIVKTQGVVDRLIDFSEFSTLAELSTLTLVVPS